MYRIILRSMLSVRFKVLGCKSSEVPFLLQAIHLSVLRPLKRHIRR